LPGNNVLLDYAYLQGRRALLPIDYRFGDKHKNDELGGDVAAGFIQSCE
jgi:hypothetical protein